MPETLWDGGPLLKQAPGVFPMGTDSVLLADFAGASSRKQLLDLGTGSGILPILLLSRFPKMTAIAIEQSEPACTLARENFSLNGLCGRVTLIQGDLRNYRELIPPGCADLTISNPPYFPANSGPEAESGLHNARGDGMCTLDDLCAAASWATRWGGSFSVVFRPERICDLFFSLRSHGFEPKRLLPVYHSAASPINLILVEARRGGKPGLSWEAPLILYNPDGTETDTLRRIYRRK